MSYKQNEGQLNKCVQFHLLQFSTRNGIFTFSLETEVTKSQQLGCAEYVMYELLV